MMNLLNSTLKRGPDKHDTHEHIALIHAKRKTKTIFDHKMHARVTKFRKRTHPQSQKSLANSTGHAKMRHDQRHKADTRIKTPKRQQCIALPAAQMHAKIRAVASPAARG